MVGFLFFVFLPSKRIIAVLEGNNIVAAVHDNGPEKESPLAQREGPTEHTQQRGACALVRAIGACASVWTILRLAYGWLCKCIAFVQSSRAAACLLTSSKVSFIST